MRTAEETRQLRTLAAKKSGQSHLREISRLGHTDPGIGRDQALLRGSNVRPPLEQRRRQSGRDFRGERLIGQAAPARNMIGIFRDQQADAILGLLDLLLEHRDRLRRRIDQLLGLAQVEQRGHAACLAGLDQPE